MTNHPSAADLWIATYQANVERLTAAHAYNPRDEHDACGVGFVAAIDGRPRRDVVTKGIEALKSVWHRGAVDADGKTGDGAGLHVQVPQSFFRDHVRLTRHQTDERSLAVGQVFLPRLSLEAQEACRRIVETEILNFGYYIYGWRQVPINIECLGEKANATRPEIEQIIVANSRGSADDQFEIDLYLIRRRIEKRVIEAQISGFYICTLSARSIIYKGMFLAEQLSVFYPDLNDARFTSNFAIYHQRYSTNTYPTWPLAQPFRMLAHNGEINTLSGNLNWMKAHETRMAHAVFGAYMDDVKPVIPIGGSDSMALDTVFEALARAGRPAPVAKAMLIPPALSRTGSDDLNAFISYCNSVMEPWDGPAALAAYDGRWVIGGMDRNGLRPMRFTRTADGLLIAGSETGMVRVDPATVVEKGRLGPGEMIAVDLAEGRLYHTDEIHAAMARRRPYRAWIRKTDRIDESVREGAARGEPVRLDRDALRRCQIAVGITQEDMELILQPMVADGKEPLGSMGDDSPLAVLSDSYRGLHHYFRQNFSQVTNPPIDSLRERRVMSLRTRLGNLGNILDEDESQCRLLQLESPVLTTGEFEAMRAYMEKKGESPVAIDCTFAADPAGEGLREALRRIRQEAEDAVRGGPTHLVLTDERMSASRVAIPMVLATGTVHTHLVRSNLRTFTSLNVRTAVCLDTHTFAVLIGVGATTVNAYLTQEAIADRQRRGLFGALTLEACLGRYKKAIDEGLLKIMSKMGISIISSYRGGCNFEAIGLSRSLVAEHFPAMTSRISGVGLTGIESKVRAQGARAFEEAVTALPIGGFYRVRKDGERHGWEGEALHDLQAAVATGSYSTYQAYSERVRSQPPAQIRDLLDFKPRREPVSIDEVESITSIRRRFITPAMSLGALSPEAHGTLNVAMNRIGAKSDSGEGGEDPARFVPDHNGDNWNSAIKQVASGRFGVTAEYLNQCREIEIKVAQGAKPGEGGQLPGFKVTELIARLRNATPGVTLISPPPHHDIYSIEDLAQLIYDLKQINPEAKVCVKLVSRTGIGTIAAGVAKAKADVILISGHSGGTGASPYTSIKYAGLPWEMGLSEVHQVLTLNRLRQNVTLRVDGGLKTGRDVVIGAILGAEEFGFGTMSLVALGCLLVRQCHNNTCPVGICTQKDELREKFQGTPEKVVNLFSFLADEVREILARLGYAALHEVIGRTELLHQTSRGAALLDDLDLNPLLAQADPGDALDYSGVKPRNPVPESLDARMIADAGPLFELREKMQLQYTVRNTQRAIGTQLASQIVRRFGMRGLQPGHITIGLRGSAGQSLGAFAVQGMKLEVVGDANDYVGKGLSGGTIVVKPSSSSRLASHLNTIIGNTVLYGATGGKLFAAGQAGERFCVRNSGALVVVEGCGANGCEYMTGGIAVILGRVGANFGAGMTGGMAFVLDPDGHFLEFLNPDTVLAQRIEVEHYERELHRLVVEHVSETSSGFAEQLLNDWERECRHFWQVVPKEMVDRLPVPITKGESAARAIPAE